MTGKLSFDIHLTPVSDPALSEVGSEAFTRLRRVADALAAGCAIAGFPFSSRISPL